MNQRYNKTFVITKEFSEKGSILTNSKVFKSKGKALEYTNRFFSDRPKNVRRHAEIYEIRHIMTRTVGRLSKKKEFVVEKKV